MWWWIGGAVAIVLLAAVIWYTTGLGRRSASTPGPTPTELQEAASPGSAAAPTERAKGEMPEMPDEPGERNGMFSERPEMQIDLSRRYVATISTERGDIVVEVNTQEAPETVNNFVFLAREGFYDGLTFHRVEPGFVIQGGDPAGDGTGGPGYTVPAEIGLKHDKGALAMARRGDEVNPERASSGSQFYITLDETHFLDGAYTVFGQVVEGMQVVESIAKGDEIQAITVEQR
jgi:cyclophilin family peptidyl-prolyl cis-trans isomerase